MEPYIGEIRLFAGDFAPRGWFFCEGQLLHIHQFERLFSLIQTYYGGDGMQNFALPDLRGRIAIQQGQGINLSKYHLGEKGGTESITLTTKQLPAHSHLVNVVNKAAKQYEATNGLIASSTIFADGKEVNSFSADEMDSTLNAKTIASSGGSEPVKISPPYLGINYIIAWDGIYPSRP